jgi:hypothetical protein
MPILQKEIDSPGAKFCALLVGKGADLSALRQNLATQCRTATVADWIWGDRWYNFFDAGKVLASGARWRGFGADAVRAAICLYRLACNVCIVGKFSVEMRIA